MPLGRQRQLRIVLFGTYDERQHPRVRVLREGLAAEGHDILVCNQPLGLEPRTLLGALRRPWRLAGGLSRLIAAWVRLAVRSRRMNRPDVVVVPGPAGSLDVHLAWLRWRRSRIVLDRTTTLVGGADGDSPRHAADASWPASLLRRVERAASRRADLVTLDAEQPGGRPDALGVDRHKAVAVPPGTPEVWFAAASSRPDHHVQGLGTYPMKVVFVGRYGPVEGATIIGQAIDRLAEHYIEWTMVGTGPDRAATQDATRGQGKVTWLDCVPAEHLPDLVAEHDVCLGIFGTTPEALQMVPLSVLQGAAAGCAIVTSATAAQHQALGPAALLVPPGQPAELAAVLAALAADPGELGRRQEAASRRAFQAFTPAAVVTSLVAHLAEGPEVPF